MKDERIPAAKSRSGKRAGNGRNPLPAAAKELEALFFDASGIGSARRDLAPSGEPSPLVDMPATADLFYDPLTAANSTAQSTEAKVTDAEPPTTS